MPVRFAIRSLSSAIVVAAAVAAVALGAGALEGTSASAFQPQPPGVSPSGPVINAAGLRAGEERSGNFTVTNPNAVATGLHINGSTSTVDDDLLDTLTARLRDRDSGDQVWSGSLNQLLAGTPAGRIAAAGVRRLEISLGLPGWAGNAYQTRGAAFDLNFTLTGDEGELDRAAPVTSIRLTKSTRFRNKRQFRKPMRLLFTGGARDDVSAVARVELSLVSFPKAKNRRQARRLRGRCTPFVPLRRKFVRNTRSGCLRVWITASGTNPWTYKFPRQRLKPGKYELRVRSIDTRGNVESGLRSRGSNVNTIKFTIKR